MGSGPDLSMATRTVLMTARSYASLKTPSKNPVGQNRWRKEHAHLAGLYIHDDTLQLATNFGLNDDEGLRPRRKSSAVMEVFGGDESGIFVP